MAKLDYYWLLLLGTRAQVNTRLTVEVIDTAHGAWHCCGFTKCRQLSMQPWPHDLIVLNVVTAVAEFSGWRDGNAPCFREDCSCRWGLEGAIIPRS